MGPHGRGRFSEKPKNSKATFLRMLKDLKSEYLSLIIIIVFAICSSVLSIVTPIYLGNFINGIMPKGTDVNSFINNPLFDFDLIYSIYYVDLVTEILMKNLLLNLEYQLKVRLSYL